MTLRIPEPVLFCNCGIEARPLIRTFRNIYIVCNCGNLITTKIRLWFIHYGLALKEFYSSLASNYFSKFSNREHHVKNHQMCIL